MACDDNGLNSQPTTDPSPVPAPLRPSFIQHRLSIVPCHAAHSYKNEIVLEFILRMVQHKIYGWIAYVGLSIGVPACPFIAPWWDIEVLCTDWSYARTGMCVLCVFWTCGILKRCESDGINAMKCKNPRFLPCRTKDLFGKNSSANAFFTRFCSTIFFQFHFFLASPLSIIFDEILQEVLFTYSKLIFEFFSENPFLLLHIFIFFPRKNWKLLIQCVIIRLHQ